MTKSEAVRIARMYSTLRGLGFMRAECESLRRASMTLRRWFERECGDGNDYGSWAIERDPDTDKPYEVRHHYGRGVRSDRVTRTPIPDRETSARKRIGAVVAARNARAAASGITRTVLSYYIQTDPRGAALYIIRPGDVPEGKDVASYYPHGVSVW
jgi:hypothetical protein